MDVPKLGFCFWSGFSFAFRAHFQLTPQNTFCSHIYLFFCKKTIYQCKMFHIFSIILPKPLPQTLKQFTQTAANYSNNLLLDFQGYGINLPAPQTDRRPRRSREAGRRGTNRCAQYRRPHRHTFWQPSGVLAIFSKHCLQQAPQETGMCVPTISEVFFNTLDVACTMLKRKTDKYETTVHNSGLLVQWSEGWKVNVITY